MQYNILALMTLSAFRVESLVSSFCDASGGYMYIEHRHITERYDHSVIGHALLFPIYLVLIFSNNYIYLVRLYWTFQPIYLVFIGLRMIYQNLTFKARKKPT